MKHICNNFDGGKRGQDMMLSIPTMALAAAVGSGCPVNQANINQYSQALNNPGSQVYMQAQNGETDLSILLDQMGVSCPDGLCDGLDGNCPSGSCGVGGSCGLDGSCSVGAGSCSANAGNCGANAGGGFSQGANFTVRGAGLRGGKSCGNQNFGGFYR